MNERLSIPPKAELHRVVIEPVAIASDDHRRTIVEFHDGEPGYQSMKVITIKTPRPGESMQLGRHYNKDRELFYVQDGVVSSLVLEDPHSGERQEYTDIEAGTKIALPQYAAHLFTFNESAILLAFNENPFDPNNLIPHEFKNK